MSSLGGNEYRVIVEQAPIMIWRSDTRGACDYFNERWLRFTGRSMEQELGNGWASGVYPDDLGRCLQTFRDSFEKRVPFEMEYRLRRHDGEYRWIFDRGAPFYEDGEFRGYIGSCVDVTERVEGQEALNRAHELEVRQLRGLLPICAHCKRIRDDAGGWHRLEQYLQERSAASFSHGICPGRFERLYPNDGE